MKFFNDFGSNWTSFIVIDKDLSFFFGDCIVVGIIYFLMVPLITT